MVRKATPYFTEYPIIFCPIVTLTYVITTGMSFYLDLSILAGVPVCPCL